MKKIVLIMALACAAMGFGATNDTSYTEVYDFKASIGVPYITNGQRVDKSCSFSGQMYLNYDENGELVSATAEMMNKKTKVNHILDFTEGFYNLMGKTNKKIYRSTPTVWFVGADAEETAGHEHIVTCSLAGRGSLTYTKATTTSCDVCGVPSSTTTFCARCTTMSGYIVGVMDCQCPEDEDWDHTLKAGPCGVLEGDLEDVRSHEASFKGTWSAKWNKKLTAAANN